MRDPNEIALDRYLRELDDIESLRDAQVAVDDAILDAACEPGDAGIRGYCDEDEFCEIVTKIKSHRALGLRGSPMDWETDDWCFEFVHGAI